MSTQLPTTTVSKPKGIVLKIRSHLNIQKKNPIVLSQIQDRFLVNRADIQLICQQFIQKHNRKAILGAITTTLMGGIISSALSVADPFKIPLFIPGIILTILFSIIWLVLRSRGMKAEDILKEIYLYAQESADYTGLFLITRVIPSRSPGSNATISLMTQEHTPSGTPFIVFQDLKPSIVDNQLNLEEVQKKLADEIGIQPDAITIEQVGSFQEIKRTSTPGNEKMIRYEYFRTSIPEELREKVEKKYQWNYLEEMLSNPTIMSRNADLLNDIKIFLSRNVQDSFYKNTNVVPIKIIWNITQKCDYDCKICATHRDKGNELNTDQKNKVLMNLLTVGKDGIREIDFSGGDPLIAADNWDIILSAQRIFGKEKVSVTTTGKGIDKVAKENRAILHDLLTNCEITVDEIDEICSTIRQQEGYAYDNRYSTTQNANSISHLTVNVPILNCNMEDTSIAQLVERISQIQANVITCALLRLMPAGKMSKFDEYPNDYNPIHFIEVFKKEAEKYSNLIIHVHCALQCFFNSDNNCNMLTNKIGIDNQGNVFACAWGGYINSIEDLKKNPFYLGNVYDNRLDDILNGKKARQMREKIEKGSTCCRLFNYYTSNPNNIYKGQDPAYKIRKEYLNAK